MKDIFQEDKYKTKFIIFNKSVHFSSAARNSKLQSDLRSFC